MVFLPLEPTILFSDSAAVSHLKPRDFRFHAPAILFIHWSAVSHTGNDMTSSICSRPIRSQHYRPYGRNLLLTISMKDFQVTANCPKGRVFEIDSQEQWDAAIAKVITKERELIGRLAKSGLYLNILNARSKKLFIHDHSFITFVLSDNSNLHFFVIRIYTKWSFP